jgi:hypothetical protein
MPEQKPQNLRRVFSTLSGQSWPIVDNLQQILLQIRNVWRANRPKPADSGLVYECSEVDMRAGKINRNFRKTVLALISAICFATITGCYAGGFTPRETGTVGGAALGAGGGALIGSSMGAPGTGALIGGLGGGLAGYLVGNSVQERDYHYYRGY